MSGVLPHVIGVSKKPQGHGYTILEVDTPNPYFKPGQILHGHEFHYSYVLGTKGERWGIFCYLKRSKGEGIMNNQDGLCYKNVLATYTHLHALGDKRVGKGNDVYGKSV